MVKSMQVKNRRIRIVGYLAAGSALLIPAVAPAYAKPPSFSHYAGSSDLKQSVYSRISHILGKELEDGAMGANTKYEQGSADKWFIEGQRYGADLIQSGVAMNDRKMIAGGIRALDWGFQRQGADGSFPGTGDPYHSTSLFVEAAARGLLLLTDYDAAAYRDTIKRDTPKVRAAANWLTQPDIEDKGRRNARPYTHRRWVLASALSQSSVLTGDDGLMRSARDFAEDGLRLQQADGVNPEHGGSDTSYQAYGVLQAERYLIADPGGPLQGRVKGMITRALDWEVAHISDWGDVDESEDSRTGVEIARNGKVKKLDYVSLQQALTIGSSLTGDARYKAAARRVARARNESDRARSG